MNNTTATGDEPGITFIAMVQFSQIIILAIVCLVGLVGNTLVIYVVIRFSKMQTVTNMYIVNLAIADECFLIGIPFLISTMIRKQWDFGHLACKAYMISTSINQFTSSIFLCIMSADRYIAVCHPISSPRWRTPFISKMVSLFAWTTSILLIIPIIQHTKEVETTAKHKSCLIEWGPPNDFFDNVTVINNGTINNGTATNGTIDNGDIPQATIFTTYTFICSFAVPLGLILIFYFEVVKKLKHVGPKNKSKEKKRSHRKVTNLVLTVVTVYVICWLPYWVMQLAIKGGEIGPFSVTMHILASCLSYCNSAINPILYAFLSDNFKKSFMKACTCAAKDVNAQLHLENSVFPRKTKQNSERLRATRATSICPNNDEECDMGPLVNRGDVSTTITMTSRATNPTSLGDSREVLQRSVVKNGAACMSQPTSL